MRSPRPRPQHARGDQHRRGWSQTRRATTPGRTRPRRPAGRGAGRDDRPVLPRSSGTRRPGTRSCRRSTAARGRRPQIRGQLRRSRGSARARPSRRAGRQARTASPVHSWTPARSRERSWLSRPDVTPGPGRETSRCRVHALRCGMEVQADAVATWSSWSTAGDAARARRDRGPPPIAEIVAAHAVLTRRRLLTDRTLERLADRSIPCSPPPTRPRARAGDRAAEDVGVQPALGSRCASRSWPSATGATRCWPRARSPARAAQPARPGEAWHLRVHRCADAYVDASPGAHRRYCSVTCQNRERVAAFRRRRSNRQVPMCRASLARILSPYANR